MKRCTFDTPSRNTKQKPSRGWSTPEAASSDRGSWSEEAAYPDTQTFDRDRHSDDDAPGDLDGCISPNAGMTSPTSDVSKACPDSAGSGRAKGDTLNSILEAQGTSPEIGSGAHAWSTEYESP